MLTASGIAVGDVAQMETGWELTPEKIAVVMSRILIATIKNYVRLTATRPIQECTDDWRVGWFIAQKLGLAEEEYNELIAKARAKETA